MRWLQYSKNIAATSFCCSLIYIYHSRIIVNRALKYLIHQSILKNHYHCSLIFLFSFSGFRFLWDFRLLKSIQSKVMLIFKYTFCHFGKWQILFYTWQILSWKDYLSQKNRLLESICKFHWLLEWPFIVSVLFILLAKFGNRTIY